MDMVTQRTAPPAPTRGPAAPSPRRRRWRRLARNAAIGVLGTIFAVWLVLFVTKGRFLRHPFERLVGSALHREVKVAGDFQLYFDPFEKIGRAHV